MKTIWNKAHYMRYVWTFVYCCEMILATEIIHYFSQILCLINFVNWAYLCEKSTLIYKYYKTNQKMIFLRDMYLSLTMTKHFIKIMVIVINFHKYLWFISYTYYSKLKFLLLNVYEKFFKFCNFYWKILFFEFPDFFSTLQCLYYTVFNFS